MPAGSGAFAQEIRSLITEDTEITETHQEKPGENQQDAWQKGNRRTLIAGIVVALAGIICVGSGVALLAWRILQPDDAVILPPGAIIVEDTPTPGFLSVPVAPPPIPADAAELVILPVSELPSPSPTGDVPDTAALGPTTTQSATPTNTITPAHTATDTATRTPTGTPTDSLHETATAEPSESPDPPTSTHAPSSTPSETPSASPTPTATRTLIPTHTVTTTVTPPPLARDPNVPDRIVIEKIGLDAPIIPVGQHPVRIAGQVYSQWDVPDDYAAGWHQNSAPLGKSGNTVLNGHHNVNGAVFHYLIRLQPGDMIVLQSGTERYKYVIAQTMMLAEEGQPLAVRQANARWILPTSDERVTLITCWPYETNEYRWVVIALSAKGLDQLTGIP